MNTTKQPVFLLGPVPILWLLLIVALTIAPLGRYLPLWFWPLAVMVLGWRVYLLHRPVPRWHVLTATLVTLAAIAVSMANGLGRETGITILSSMAVLKLLEARTRRDAWIVIALGFFLIMTRFLYSQSLMLFPWPLLSVLVMTYTVLLLEHHAHTTHKRQDRQLTREQWFHPLFFRQAGRYLILAIPLAVALFVLFPRLSTPFWGSPDNFGQGKTGLGGSMSPGSIAELFMDDSPAMRIVFDEQRPPRQHMYWRGPVLERFDGDTWHVRDTTQSSPTVPIVPDAPVFSYTVELEPHGQHFLPVLDFPLAAPKGAMLAIDLHLHRTRPVNQLLHYQARSMLTNPLPVGHLAPWYKKQLLSLPEHSNPRSRRLVARWHRQTPEPQALIQRILTWFHEQSFYYTFTPPPLLRPHTIDAFLFDTRAGFCEHYASAFTFMMRAAGIPARVVTGYQGGLDNGDYWLVRQSDAHAWSEVWLESHGWLRIDPTAAVAPDRVSASGRAWLNQARHWYDADWLNRLRLNVDQWRYRWNRWVRNFNQQQQKNVLQSLGLDNVSPTQVSLLMGLAVLLGGLLGLLGMHTHRKSTPHLPAERLFQSVEQKITRKGVSRRPAEGPVDYLHRVADTWPALGESLRQFARLYARCRYAADSRNLPNKHPDLRRLRQLTSALVRRLDESA